MQQRPITSGRSVLRDPKPEDFTMHTHHTHEIIYFISGDADYAVEGTLYPLRCGDMLLMRKSEAHNLIPKSATIYERIVVNFDPALLWEADPEGSLAAVFDDRPLGRYNRFEAKLFPDNHWLFYLKRICDAKEQWRKKIYLLALLEEISEGFAKVRDESLHPQTGRTARIISYINEHLFEPVTLEELSKVFYVSRSQLNRIFKRDTGSTVYNYVVVKRLFEAQRLLIGGAAPSQVYEQCGFQDYVSFYKAYKRQFGRSPKNDHVKS